MIRGARLALLAVLLFAPLPAAAAKRASSRPAQPPAGAPPMTLKTLTPISEVPVTLTPAPFLIGMEDRFVVATREGKLSAYGLHGGDALWKTDLERPLIAAPVALPGHLAVLFSGNEIALVDAGDGHVTARAAGDGASGDTGSFLSALPTGLALASAAGSLRLIKPEDGAVLWDLKLSAPPAAAAADCGGRILVGLKDGTLVSADPADGKTRWIKKLRAPLTTETLCVGNHAYVGSADNRLHALKIRKRGCRQRWTYLTGGDISGRPLFHEGRVIFSSYDTYLYALEADNGHLAWKVRLGRRPRPDNVIVGDLLLTAPLNTERLEGFRLPAGTQAAALPLASGKDRFVSPPARAGAMVIIAAALYGDQASRVLVLDPTAQAPPTSAR